MTKHTHGGKRPGAGNTNKYGEESRTLAIRVPVSRYAHIHKLFKRYLKRYEL